MDYNALHLYAIEAASNSNTSAEIRALLSIAINQSSNVNEYISLAARHLLQIKSDDFLVYAKLLAGKYISYRYASDGRIILENMEIHQSGSPKQIITFSSFYATRQSYVSTTGYIFPREGRALFLAGIAQALSRPHLQYAIIKDPPPGLRNFSPTDDLEKKIFFLHGIILDIDYNGMPFSSGFYCELVQTYSECLLAPSIYSTSVLQSSFGNEKLNIVIQFIGNNPTSIYDHARA